MDTPVYPTPAPNPSKQAEVNPQGEQQTCEQPNTTAEAIPPWENYAEPMAGSSWPLRQTRSGRIIKSELVQFKLKSISKM